ncbi:hypothetical protein ACLKA7_002319 [Drosophila subpalustris]
MNKGVIDHVKVKNQQQEQYSLDKKQIDSPVVENILARVRSCPTSGSQRRSQEIARRRQEWIGGEEFSPNPESHFVQTLRGCFVAQGDCPNKNVTFWLYSKETRNNPKLLDPLDLDPKDFLPKQKVIILLHGYSGHRDYAPNTSIRPALLDNEFVYVISIDYGPLVREPCFPQSILNAPLVSKCLAQLINNLVDSGIVENDLLHIIGFSLGSQVAGQTANYVKQKLHRITGLDPAKPFFALAISGERLDAEDADFVDVIHTDPPERGVLKPAGHVDFYPNFRVGDQPGCEREEDPGSCNHNRAPEFYAESINSKLGFWGIRCHNLLPHVFGRCAAGQSQALMGYYVSPIFNEAASGVEFEVEWDKVAPSGAQMLHCIHIYPPV